MQVFLGILSTIGWVLLIILLVILVLLALILFLPVVYRGRIQKEQALQGRIVVRWLFGAVYFRLLWQGGSPVWTLRIFGIPLDRIFQKDKKERKAPKEFAPAKKQPTIRPGERAEEAADTALTAAPDSEAAGGNVQQSGETAQKSGEKAAASEKPKPEAMPEEAEQKEPWYRKIGFTFRSVCDKLKKVKDGFGVFRRIWPRLKKLLLHLMPKKLTGYVNFGLEDPSQTGMLLGLFGALCIPIPKTFHVNPDFEEKKLECDVKIAGRLVIIVVLVRAIQILMDPEIRSLLGKNKKTKKKSENASEKR